MDDNKENLEENKVVEEKTPVTETNDSGKDVGQVVNDFANGAKQAASDFADKAKPAVNKFMEKVKPFWIKHKKSILIGVAALVVVIVGFNLLTRNSTDVAKAYIKAMNNKNASALAKTIDFKGMQVQEDADNESDFRSDFKEDYKDVDKDEAEEQENDFLERWEDTFDSSTYDDYSGEIEIKSIKKSKVKGTPLTKVTVKAKREINGDNDNVTITFYTRNSLFNASIVGIY